MEKIDSGKILTLGDNFILTELSYFTEPPNINAIFFELQTNGYNVILAHPERYLYWHDKKDKYRDLYDRGIYLQLNINSLTGWYSKESKKIAEYLIDNKLIKFLGSDTHNLVYPNELRKCTAMPYLHKAFETNKIMNYIFF
jgi:tyrosine-protein phosphatase YwqE